MPSFSVTDNLAWTVSKRPLYFTGNDGQPTQWTEKVAVVRDDTGRGLGVVSPDYEQVQNADLLKLIDPMVQEGLLTVENMGYLKHGAKVFAQAKINSEFQVLGEEYNAYVTLLNCHVGNASVAIGTTATRVICGNTFSMAYKDINEKYRHNAGVNERVLESTAVLNYVNGAMETYAKYVEKLATTPCSGVQFKSAVGLVYGKDTEKMRDSFVDQLNNLFYNGKGNEGKTFYDAFNAITEYGSNYSRKSESGRFQYANFGTGAKVNLRAMSVLTELAAV